MSRKEDFIEAGIQYRFEHSKPMAIGGDNFVEMAKEMNRVKPFEAGAEYGYQYAIENVIYHIRQIYVQNNNKLPDSFDEDLKRRMEE